jgi:hypothetical protein
VGAGWAGGGVKRVLCGGRGTAETYEALIYEGGTLSTTREWSYGSISAYRFRGAVMGSRLEVNVAAGGSLGRFAKRLDRCAWSCSGDEGSRVKNVGRRDGGDEERRWVRLSRREVVAFKVVVDNGVLGRLVVVVGVLSLREREVTSSGIRFRRGG